MAWTDITGPTFWQGAYFYGNAVTPDTVYTWSGTAWIPSPVGIGFLQEGLTPTTSGLAALAANAYIRVTVTPDASGVDDGGSTFSASIGLANNSTKPWSPSLSGLSYSSGVPIAVTAPVVSFLDAFSHVTYFLTAAGGVTGPQGDGTGDYWVISKIEVSDTIPVGFWQDFVGCREV